MSSGLLAGCQDQHGTHSAPQLASVYLFAGYRYAVFFRADRGVRAYDAVAAAWPASGATSSASATATVADAALCAAAAAATATTSVSSFASASVASSCYAAVAEPATAAHTAAA